MDDQDLIARIHALMDEEHKLEREGDPGDAERLARLDTIEVALDQCWDLLRQRRARRTAGVDPDAAGVRPPEVVEHYQQ